ncbi:hypothetical protein FQN54_001965 [Arachnomyces sp. PD_36]|nr:hypothetical protein FQN54_001965 [Arachnomyces sp. PD_36]
MPRLEHDKHVKHQTLLKAFLTPQKRALGSQVKSEASSYTSSENSEVSKSFKDDQKFQVVIPISRATSEAVTAPSLAVKHSTSSTPSHSSRVHDGLSSFYHVDDDEKRIEKAAYPKAKAKPQKAHLPLSTPFTPQAKSLTTSSRISRSRIDDMYAEKLKSLKGPAVKLSIGSQKLSIDSNFQFVNSYKLQNGVKQGDPDFSPPCNCGDVCDIEICECVPEVDETELVGEIGDPIVQYVRGPGGLRVLDPTFLKKKTGMIFECSSRCQCASTCFNRVVQHGRTIKLEIFDTHGRGFGLRSPEPIYAGQFIDCYLGEVITESEADIREEATEHQASYLFSLDYYTENDTMNVVDGRKFGGVTRFINHSCRPNLKLFPATQNHGDRYIYDLAFFALRDIPPMTELTFDYNPHEKGSKHRVDPDAVKCLCGESNCRGQLWPNNRKTNR